MKKLLLLAFMAGLCSQIFAQSGVGLGFQYGRAWITDKGKTLREVREPGALITFRLAPQNVGFFARVGMLFPSSVTEGDVTLTYSEYDYIFFINGALGASFTIPLNDRFSFFIETGISINDLRYGGSYQSTIDASWEVKLENMGTWYGGYTFNNIKMRETYNDIALGIIGNVGIRLNLTQKCYFELATAVSFDFLRLRSYKFYADFTSGPAYWQDVALGVFPRDKLKIVEEGGTEKAKELILETSGSSNIFKQFTIIPSITIGYSF